ncbi:MAG TPA: alcohol dehydrogenase catalytic domain-containing protein [Acidimicrobiales bacterium]|nr:alcohol dehydrogenase catalytic domain-containing protein [Acidimicrobiales bacterium]
MHHVVVDAPRRVSVVEVPDPSLPGPDGAVVAVELSSICGSDLHFYEGDIPVGDGVPIGHEFIGTVAEVGPEVRRFKPGDRVLTASVTGCGYCEGCRTGDPIRCERGPKVFGSGELGSAQATMVAVPSADFQMLAIPEGVSDEAALLLTDNLCTGWIGAKRAGVVDGATVVVLGLGAVGLCAVRCALAQGAGRVLVADPVRARRERAVRSGGTSLEGETVRAVLDATDGRGADAVIDCVALDATLDDAFNSVRAGGTLSVLGVHDLNPYPLQILLGLFRSLTLRMTTAPVHQTWAELIPLVVKGRLQTDGIFTHRFPLSSAPEAYAAMARRGGDCMKVILEATE